jgi:hypothetical protein
MYSMLEVGRDAVEPDPFDCAGQEVFAEFVCLFAADDLLHVGSCIARMTS